MREWEWDCSCGSRTQPGGGGLEEWPSGEGRGVPCRWWWLGGLPRENFEKMMQNGAICSVNNSLKISCIYCKIASKIYIALLVTDPELDPLPEGGCSKTNLGGRFGGDGGCVREYRFVTCGGSMGVVWKERLIYFQKINLITGADPEPPLPGGGGGGGTSDQWSRRLHWGAKRRKGEGGGGGHPLPQVGVRGASPEIFLRNCIKMVHSECILR